MTNATKSLAIIFVSLLVVTGLVKWTDTSSSSQAFRSTLVEVDQARVNRIVIEAPTQNRTLTLKKEGSSWQVTGKSTEEGYPADSTSIIRAIEQLNDLSVQAVATRNPQKYTRFKVDSTGTTVSLYNNENLLSSIIIGAPQIISRQQYNNYVRPVDDEAVYSVEGLLSSTYGKDLEGWRDKAVWDLDDSQISRIDFLFPADSSYSIQRAGDNEWVSDGDTLSASSVSRVTSRLSSLSASGFVEGVSPSSFGTELYAIQLQLEDGTQKTLRLKLPGEEASSYHAVAGDYPYTFTLSKASFGNSVLKARGELLTN
ncbi:DUF4340 domain-containing protein [Aliifodinibius sp. S!AR15-10]|uniref:DUF4340 domain-containing protein n=1 Tax=Aliifodinibius sp. S!AR15-10 TaxID=2950437 RepID=UPI002860627C|nr:DUF4340 domain-containing protein [Aliifodinibius sp. S!AR15-10]MDR8392822.1 DUF4340 domain-containing protein [Aliifodinibius sp. S!AR15-10]